MANEKNIDTLIAEDTQRRTPFRTMFDRLEGFMGPTGNVEEANLGREGGLLGRYREVAPGDPDSPIWTGGYPQEIYDEYQANADEANLSGSKIHRAMAAIDNMEGTGVTDWGSAKDMMDVNVRDYVRAVHSVDTPKPKDMFQMVRDWWRDRGKKPEFMGVAPIDEVNKQVTGKEIY